MIRVLFLDVGGVLMTNGWDHTLRKKTAKTFGIEYEMIDARHQIVFDKFEKGGMTFEKYLQETIFYEKRNFTLDEVKKFIFDAVRPYPEMIEYIKSIKQKHGLKIVILSNEGRELALDRTARFHLTSFVDFFIFSAFVHLRKPDPEIFLLALDFVQCSPQEIVYIDDRKAPIDVAASLGIHAIQHTSLANTQQALKALI